jgi:hypothetical protein
MGRLPNDNNHDSKHNNHNSNNNNTNNYNNHNNNRCTAQKPKHMAVRLMQFTFGQHLFC